MAPLALAAEGAELVGRQGGILGVFGQEGRGDSVGKVGVQEQVAGCSNRGGWGEGLHPRGGAQQGMGGACGAYLSSMLALKQIREREGSMGHTVVGLHAHDVCTMPMS